MTTTATITAEELADIRGRLVAHELLIASLIRQLNSTGGSVAAALLNADKLLMGVPINPTKEAQDAKKSARQYIQTVGNLAEIDAISDAPDIH